MKSMSLRDHVSSLVVTTLSASFGVALIQATSYLATMISADDIASHGSVQVALAMVAGVFIVIAVYVGSIVTANTFATIIAGRTRTIALMRLIGSSSAALRRSVATEGLLVGIFGAIAGTLLGLLISIAGLSAMVTSGFVPRLDYGTVDPLVVLPMVFVVLTTWWASWVGSKKVLAVTPIQATGAAQEPSREESMRRPVRNAMAGVLFFGGLVVLAAGVAIGMVSPLGFLVSFVGGMASFSGVVAGAHLVIPRLLAVSGRLLGSSSSARLAAQNGIRYPERSARTTIGLVIGVTLVTTFAVAAQGYLDMIRAAQVNEPESYQAVDSILLVTVGVFSVLIGFSALIAAIGMINNLSLSVLQRSRELGLLRALGFTARQVRAMIIAESVQLTVTGVGLGLILGVVYGWAGAQSLLGAIYGSPGLVAPSVPWLLLVVLVVGAGLLTLAAAQAPARRATRVSPVQALAVD
ncbi:putative ABC transport system permease protein [Homoserinimonas aerilata]|uniref:Putative ABC transport system permease protein n=1 Tax=Homoserinimonas aerilata TaxID=1162970 RepID=A0A542YIJ4_9MICO|nr:ABC transporter permease [Homoserinimonas aerilata]TQL47841.1 putative ABC transport system permease protein [Homoserinimonas aerilata]